MIIYKAVNKINGKVYIGQTKKSLARRLYEHQRCYVTAFGSALRKHSLNNFCCSIIESCKNREESNSREMFWIKYYRCISPNGYNLNGGGNGSGHSESTLAKFKLINLGRKRSKETIAKISASKIGKKHTPEQTEKLRTSLKKRYSEIPHHMNGKNMPDETKKKISLNHLNKGVNKGPKNGMYGKHSHNLGKKITEEQKKKISEIRKEQWKNDEYRQKIMNTSESKSIKLKKYWAAKKEKNLCAL